jgi:acyl-CoA dehydrogenase
VSGYSTKIACEIAAAHADDVDRTARFPSETIHALKEAGLLSAAVPAELGGAGFDIDELAQVCTALGRQCASSAMIFAMHSIQVVSIANHRGTDPDVEEYLRDLVREQRLIASVTSEVGTGGDLRSSIACVRRGQDAHFHFEKATTTSSYCEFAEDLLLTLRREESSAPGDQVLVLIRQGDFDLMDVGEWNTLGMRGTCSPPARIQGEGAVWQILPDPFRVIASTTMVPASHILWAAVWLGIGTDAYDRARRFLQVKARKDPDGFPIAANRLANLATRVRNMRSQLETVIRLQLERDSAREVGSAGRGDEMSAVLAMNDLKLATSEAVVECVSEAIQIIGIAAYKNEGEFSLGRHLRDAHSASLMINNDRIRATNADLLLVYKGD